MLCFIHYGFVFEAFTGHESEGFALDWSKTETGVLASGRASALIKKHKYYKKEHIRQKIRLMLNSLENNVADLNSNLNLGSESFSRWWFDI